MGSNRQAALVNEALDPSWVFLEDLSTTGALRPIRAADYTTLIIDDDPDQLEVLSSIMRSSGFKVIGVDSASGAFQVLSHRHIDLIVSDIYLPSINGLEIAQYVSTVEHFPRSSRVPTILVSAGSPDLEDVALESGADMFCPKSQARELLPKLARFLLQ